MDSFKDRSKWPKKRPESGETPYELIPTSNSIIVKWQKPKSCADIMSYQIMYRIGSEKCKIIESETEEKEIFDLAMETEYEVLVFSVDIDGETTEVFTDKATTIGFNSEHKKQFHRKYDMRSTSNSIVIKWQNLETSDTVQLYQVKYRLVSERKFLSKESDKGEVEITGLKPKETYDVRVFLIDGDCKSHLMFKDIKTTLDSNEGKSNSDLHGKSFDIKPFSTSLIVSWAASPELKDVFSYQVKYRKSSDETIFQEIQVKPTEREVEICSLTPRTRYEVIVFWVEENGNNHRMFSDRTTTSESKSEALKDVTKMSKIDKTKHPNVYYMKPVHTQTKGEKENMQFRICDMICKYEQLYDSNKEKNLLLLGATGTGKSTFIEALVNYIADVSYSDDHRFSIINKTAVEKSREAKQTESQTSSVTVYRIPKIPGSKVEHKVNIIDTPGFNDTRKGFDKTITDQIKTLFDDNLEHIDAIFIVLQLSTNRLTDGQIHVFKQIAELFGKDVEPNIFIVMTYDDGGSPDGCLNVVKEAGIPYNTEKPFFRFNNSNIFSHTGQGIHVWEQRAKSFSGVFQMLQKVRQTTLKKCKKVLEKRQRCEIQLKALEEDIKLTVESAVQILWTEEKMREPKKVYKRRNSIHCFDCKRTCHEGCWVMFDSQISYCYVFEYGQNNKEGRCCVCQCPPCKHERGQFKYLNILKPCSETFITAIDTRNDLSKLEKSFEDYLAKLQSEMEQISECIESLNKIALSKPRKNEFEEYMGGITENLEASSVERKLTEKCFFLFKENISLKDRKLELLKLISK